MSCLYERGGNGIGENFRDSNQWTCARREGVTPPELPRAVAWRRDDAVDASSSSFLTLSQHRRRIDGHGLLGRHVGPVLEVVVLALLLGLEPEPRESPQILFTNRLVDGRAALDPFPIVVGDVRPPAGATT